MQAKRISNLQKRLTTSLIMKKRIKKLLEYIIPQRIAVQLGSRNTCFMNEEGNIENLLTTVFEDGKEYSGKYLCAGDFWCHTEGLYRYLWPVCRREVTNIEAASFFFKYLFSKLFHYKPLRVYSSVSTGTSEGDFRGLVYSILSNRQVKNASFVFEPIAAAVGMGLDIQREIYILDIGHTSSVFSIISDCKVKFAHGIYSPCICDEVLYALKMKMVDNNILVSERMLIRILRTIKDKGKYVVHGPNPKTALPMQFEITREQVFSCYSPMIKSIINRVKAFMKEKNLSFSVESPLYLIGGGSCLAGISEIFAKQGINVVIPEDSDRVIARGLQKIAMNKCAYPIDREKVVFCEVKSPKQVRNAQRLLPLRD